MRNKNYYCSFVFAKFKSVINFQSNPCVRMQMEQVQQCKSNLLSLFSTNILSSVSVSGCVCVCVCLCVCMSRQVKFLNSLFAPIRFSIYIYDAIIYFSTFCCCTFCSIFCMIYKSLNRRWTGASKRAR